MDLYESDDNPELKNEIDILCMLGGKFHAVEVKTSASMFLKKPGAVDKFVSIIEMLRPDVAMLSFERYSKDSDEVPDIKIRLQKAEQSIRERLGAGVTLKIVVAEDIDEFNDFPRDLGWYGDRTRQSRA